MHNFLLVANALTTLAALILAVSLLNRHNAPKLVRDITLGALLGLCAVLALMDPLRIGEGVQIDGRNLFVGFAAAISGPVGALIAMGITGLTRLYIGGIGVVPALASMIFCALAGLVWRKLDDREMFGADWRWPIFGGLLCLSIPTLLMLPDPLGWQAMTQGGPYQVLTYIAGAMLIGFALEHENKFSDLYHDLEADAEIDPLTTALNRRGLSKKFDQTVAMSAATTCLAAIVDVDNFKSLNDRYGHETGDQALRKVVESIKKNTRSSDIVARVGGDEFAVFAFGLDKDQAAAFHAKLKRILTSGLQLPCGDGKRSLPFSATIGVKFHEGIAPKLENLLAAADQEMLRLKSNFRTA